MLFCVACGAIIAIRDNEKRTVCTQYFSIPGKNEKNGILCTRVFHHIPSDLVNYSEVPSKLC